MSFATFMCLEWGKAIMSPGVCLDHTAYSFLLLAPLSLAWIWILILLYDADPWQSKQMISFNLSKVKVLYIWKKYSPLLVYGLLI